jgi:hypothetical protein
MESNDDETYSMICLAGYYDMKLWILEDPATYDIQIQKGHFATARLEDISVGCGVGRPWRARSRTKTSKRLGIARIFEMKGQLEEMYMMDDLRAGHHSSDSTR